MTAPGDDLLQQMPVFQRLSSDDRKTVAASAHVARYGRGTHIFREGDADTAFLVIVEGRVKVYRMTPAGKEVILEIFGPGDPLAAVAVYEGRPFPASAIAIDDTTCVRIEQREFFGLLEHHPAIVRGLLSGMTMRLAELTRRLSELTGARVDARFARLFLKLADQIGRTERGGSFVPLALGRQELASLTGTTIETAIRIMSRWQKDNVLHTEKDGFLLIDRNELESIATRS
ncbi:MAG: Crp/Fnr family transcriptional regulator [Acidobacteria bacterium]|nr:Crp/Fnr family transcriptional regulator [Acidobacteriota bacterium]